MRIKKEGQEEKLILKLSGRLDTDTAPELQKTAETDLDNITELEIHMEELEYVSSAGLRVLLAISNKMEEKEGTMTVHHVKEEVMEVFEITGFDKILNIL